MLEDCKALKSVLEKHIRNCSKVFIIGHCGPDFDSFGASIGLYSIARNFYKKAFIIIDDDPAKIEPGVKRILDAEKDNYRIISKSEFEGLADEKSLVISAV